MTDTVSYANKPTDAFLALEAARIAGGAAIDFLSGTLVIGDGNGAVPLLSDMIAANGVIHEVWRGATIVAVRQNADKPSQIDIQTVIPAAVGGVEVGPFEVRELALLLADGTCMVVAQIPPFTKSVASEGGPGDYGIIVSIGTSAADVVILTPGATSFVTQVELQAAINAEQPTATAPLTTNDSTDDGGWLRRVFGLRAARQPSTALGAVVAEADASGYGRPATDAEFAAGASAGGFGWPWATLQQIKAALSAIVIPVIPGALAPLSFNAGMNRYEARAATNVLTGVGRTASAGEIAARTTNTNPDAGGAPGPAWVRPEDMPQDAWGVGLGCVVEAGSYLQSTGGYALVGWDAASPPIASYSLNTTQLKVGSVLTGAQLKAELAHVGVQVGGAALGTFTASKMDLRAALIADDTQWLAVKIVGAGVFTDTTAGWGGAQQVVPGFNVHFRRSA